MSMNDPLAAVLSSIVNSEKTGKDSVFVSQSSKLITGTLQLMQDNLHIGGYEKVDHSRGGIIKINLIGKVNKCGVIKPRHAVSKGGYEKYEKRYLPAKGFGFLVVSTSKGLMSQAEAEKKGLGGKLIAYCY